MMGKIGRPVQRVEDPAVFRPVLFRKSLFGQEIMPWEKGRKPIEDHLLRPSVRIRDQVNGPLEVNLAPRVKISFEKPARLPSGPLGSLQVTLVFFHGFSILSTPGFESKSEGLGLMADGRNTGVLYFVIKQRIIGISLNF